MKAEIGIASLRAPLAPSPDLTEDTDLKSERWFVVKTQPFRERWAAENCARQGCRFYLPEILVPTMVKVAGRVKHMTRLQRLFPCHLFVLTPGMRWHFLHNTFGVTSIIMVGPIPGVISGVELARVRHRENKEGYVDLPEPPPKFPTGAKVRLSADLLAGGTGVVVGMAPGERVKVLMDFLGRKTTFLVAQSNLEVLA